ncbi:MAG TPA: Hpt domain-containing protein, partial [Ramlibacter sp.]|uniref:Hpt domain-containing protein n=1 Tax=Ramlibacter sp. TaxID=1917967 RepID=UPI002D7EE762
MARSDAQFDRKLAAIFEAEAAGHVQRMQAALAQVEPEGGLPRATLEVLFRAAHSLKGAARAVGRDGIETLCHATEGVLAALQRERLAWTDAAGDLLHDAVAALERELRGAGPAGALAALVARGEALLRTAPPASQSQSQSQSPAATPTSAPAPTSASSPASAPTPPGGPTPPDTPAPPAPAGA